MPSARHTNVHGDVIVYHPCEHASAATTRPRPTTARTKIPPSDDLQRKPTARQPDLHQWMRPQRRTERRTDSDDDRTERESTERTTEKTGQSDDPNLIDDVV